MPFSRSGLLRGGAQAAFGLCLAVGVLHAAEGTPQHDATPVAEVPGSGTDSPAVSAASDDPTTADQAANAGPAAAPIESGATEAAVEAGPMDQPADAGPVEPAAEANVADPATADAAERRITEQEQAWIDGIHRVESQGGAYDASLSQQLVGLGRTYQEAGMHTEAVQVLGRAAHITRVNEGLYNASSIPIQEMMIESYAALGQWKEVGTRYHRVFLDQYKLYGDNDIRLLPPLRKLSGWHVRAYLENLDSESENGPLNHLLAARQLYDAAINILSANYGPGDARLVDTLRESSLVSYYLARTIPREPEAGFSFSSQAPGASQRSDAFTGGTQIYSYRGFSSGLEALEHVVAIHRANPEATAEERGKAIAELGDWNLLFGRPQNAFALYREAYATVAQSGLSAEQVETMFSRPVALPATQLSMFGESDVPPPGSSFLVAVFDINERGRALRVAIEPTDPPAPRRHVTQARKAVQGMMFRPRLSNGEAIAASGLRYQYAYTP